MAHEEAAKNTHAQPIFNNEGLSLLNLKNAHTTHKGHRLMAAYSAKNGNTVRHSPLETPMLPRTTTYLSTGQRTAMALKNIPRPTVTRAAPTPVNHENLGSTDKSSFREIPRQSDIQSLKNKIPPTNDQMLNIKYKTFAATIKEFCDTKIWAGLKLKSMTPNP